MINSKADFFVSTKRKLRNPVIFTAPLCRHFLVCFHHILLSIHSSGKIHSFRTRSSRASDVADVFFIISLHYQNVFFFRQSFSLKTTSPPLQKFLLSSVQHDVEKHRSIKSMTFASDICWFADELFNCQSMISVKCEHLVNFIKCLKLTFLKIKSHRKMSSYFIIYYEKFDFMY